MSLSLKFPLKTGNHGYESFTDEQTKEAIQQNFKMLLLTSPGEYVMDSDFGVGLYNYLFEQDRQASIRSIKPSIINQVRKYMPYVKINKIELDFSYVDSNALRVSINYRTSQSELDELFNLTVSA